VQYVKEIIVLHYKGFNIRCLSITAFVFI